jgi:hypothetical protein
MNRLAPALLLALVLLPFSAPSVAAKGRAPAPRAKTTTSKSKTKTVRSSSSKREFQRSHPCPSTGRTSGACPGYVIDHIVPLKRGGADSPVNMQWQNVAAAKAKDRIE